MRFQRMKLKFGKVIHKLKCIILNSSASLSLLQSILGSAYRDLKPKLSKCVSIDEVLEIIEEKCSLLQLTCMEEIADIFEIKEAQECIRSYYNTLSDFCQEIRLESCIGKRFSSSSQPLKCETVEFILDWKTDEYTLNDIKDLLSKAFGELAKEVKVVVMKTGNSIILTCSAPHNITSLLVLDAQMNISILKDMGVMSLSVGYCIILEDPTSKKV